MTVEEDDMHCIDIMVTNREKDLTYIYIKLQVCVGSGKSVGSADLIRVSSMESRLFQTS